VWSDLTLARRCTEYWSGIYSEVTSLGREVKQAKCSRSSSAGNYRYVPKQVLRTEQKLSQVEFSSLLNLVRGEKKTKAVA